MKTWILALMMVVGMGASAQHGREKHTQFTPEQRAELQAKRMTLALDLNEKQQIDLQKVFTDRNKKAEQFKSQMKANKEAGKKLTNDEKFAMKNRMLDEKIAMKGEMKKILNADQYTKWENMKKQQKHKFKKRHQKPHTERRR